ncbi:hypothetical protein ACTWPT_22930 [Nonomuraea sp. 3N208]|uniref:hypothetical protein n=1 Tax=Nonomuraea sp. 3N208 TaxID=3457421 RepID=UPI003FCDEB91
MEIIEVAGEVLRLTDPEQAGKYVVQVKGEVHGLAQGDHQGVTMNFGTPGKSSDEGRF